MINIRSTIFLILNIAFGCTVCVDEGYSYQEMEDNAYQEIDNFPLIITADNVNTPLCKIPGYKGGSSLYSSLLLPLEEVISSVAHLRNAPVKFNRIINHLLALGANPNDCRCGINLIGLAKHTENFDLIQKLINHGGKVERDVLYRQYMHYDYPVPVFPKKSEVCDLLVQHGADIDVKDIVKLPNYSAYPNLVKHLLNNGITVDLISIQASAHPAKKSILRVFDALQTSKPTDPDAKYLVSAYLIFQQGNHEPLRQMLITQPWVLCQLTRNKQMPKDEEWVARGKPIAGNAFAVERMTIACQQALKPECIKPLIRYLALAQTDGRTMCERKQVMEMYNVALDAKSDAFPPEIKPSKIEELEDKE